MGQKITIKQMLARMEENWPETASAETAAMLGLIRLNDIVAEHTNKIVADFDLTPAAFEVLATLRALPEPRQLTPTELYRSILITSGGMTKVLKQLESGGSIERIKDSEDKRSSLVKLTKGGERLAEQSMKAVSEGDRLLFSGSLSQKEVTNLGDILLQALSKLEKD